MGMVGKLEIATPSDREMAMARTFEAPAALVYRAYTEPELLKRWLLGPDGWTMTVCEVDLRVGGAYRYVWRRDRDGLEMGMGGEYRELDPPTRIVQTEHFDDAWYPGDALVTTTFTEDGGRTRMISTVLYDTKEARDGVLASGMETGVETSYDRLERLLASMPD
jgi:uncharacterized protein YndB with AHSA1/START domain